MMARAGAAVLVLGLLGVAGVFAFGGDEDEVPPVATQLAPEQDSIIEYSDPVASPDNGEEQGRVPEETPAAPSSTLSNPPANVASGDPGPALPPPPTDDKFLDLLGRLEGSYTPRATLIGVRDTAVAAWEHPSATRLQRAFAAYVAANASVSLGDTTSAVAWLQRAVDLRPDYQPYRSQLEILQDLETGY